MAIEGSAEGNQQGNPGNPATGFGGKIEAKYRELKENAETYPYVWASYAAVYGGFGFWLLYRWRKLRKTEDRVRALHERLRQLMEAEESAAASSRTAAASSSSSTAADSSSSNAASSRSAAASSSSSDAASSSSSAAASSSENSSTSAPVSTPK